MPFERWRYIVPLRLRSIFRGKSVEGELDDELQYHLERQIELNIERGLTPDDARTAALRSLDGVAQRKEECRDVRRVAVVENLGRDLRLSLRSLAKQPMFVLAATLSIAVGVGANTTVFSLANQLLLSPPTAHRPDRLVYIASGNGSHVSRLQWRDLQESGALAQLAGYQIEREVNWTADDRAITLIPLIVTSNFFDLLGAQIAMGRAFTREEAERNPHVAVVSHGFWRRHLAADPEVLGRSLVLNGEAFTVLGVLPSDWRSFPGYGVAPELYLPVSRTLMPDLDVPNAATVQLVGRLHDGQSVGAGRVALSTVGRRLGQSYGSQRFGELRQFSSVVLGPREFPAVRAFFAVLLVVVGLVLAIACANVAGLLLARGTVTRREMALRAALGASRARLVQQQLTETLWLAILGSGCGLVLTFVVVQAIARVPLPLPIPIQLATPIDPPLVIYSIVLVLVTATLAGLAPAWQTTRSSLSTTFTKDEPRYTHRRWTVRGLLVMGQVAVSFVLLVTALLFLRNLARTHAADPGFDTVNTVVAQVGLVEGRHTREARASLLLAAVERLQALPGVDTATFALALPLTVRSGRTTGARVQIEGSDELFLAGYEENLVGPDYFRTMGIALAGGRDFDERDRFGAPSVIIVNREFVRRHLSAINPIGRRLLLPGAGAPEAAEIVGVVANSKHRMLGESQQAAIYRPYLQRANPGQFVHVLARTDGNPEALVGSIDRAVAELDRTAAVDVRTMPSMLAFAFLPSRVGAALLGSLGTLGLILAMAGLFALISYSAARRTTEIGIRMALGASRRAVMRLVLGDAVVLVACGVAIGLSIAVFVTRPLTMFLVSDLTASDPASFVGTVLVLGLVCIAASWAPTRRALRIEPAIALRDE
jgi:predicted permease